MKNIYIMYLVSYSIFCVIVYGLMLSCLSYRQWLL